MHHEPITSAAICRSRSGEDEGGYVKNEVSTVRKESDKLFAMILASCLTLFMAAGVCMSQLKAPEYSQRATQENRMEFRGYQVVSEIPDAAVFQARLQERYFAACVSMAVKCAASEEFAVLKKGYCLGRSEFYGTASFPSAPTQLEAYFQAPVDGARDGMRGCSF